MLSKSLRVAVLHTTSLPTAHLLSYTLQKRTVTQYWPAFILLAGPHLVHVARLPSFSLLANISYQLLVGPHSPRWLSVPTRRSSALILHAGLLLPRVARLTSFLLTYIRTFGRNTVLGIGSLHLVRVARLCSIAALAHSYVLLVCPHSPCWPTSRTGCSSALIPHTVLLLRRVARLISILLTYIRTCGRNALLGISGLHLVRVARLSSFAALAYSYVLLFCPHSPHWRTAPARFSFDLVFADLHSDMWQKRRVRHQWPKSRTCCSFVHIRCAGLLVRFARLPSFSLLANISYRLLVGPHSPRCPTSLTRCSFDLHFANLCSDVWQKRRVRHRWPTSRTCCSFVLIRRADLLLRVARLPSFSTLVYGSYAFLV